MARNLRIRTGLPARNRRDAFQQAPAISEGCRIRINETCKFANRGICTITEEDVDVILANGSLHPEAEDARMPETVLRANVTPFDRDTDKVDVELPNRRGRNPLQRVLKQAEVGSVFVKGVWQTVNGIDGAAPYFRVKLGEKPATDLMNANNARALMAYAEEAGVEIDVKLVGEPLKQPEWVEPDDES